MKRIKRIIVGADLRVCPVSSVCLPGCYSLAIKAIIAMKFTGYCGNYGNYKQVFKRIE